MAASERLQIVTANNKVLNLLSPYTLQEINGVNLPGTQDRVTRSPEQSGATYLGALVEPRSIILTILIKGCTRNELGTLRKALSTFFNPRVAPLQLRIFLGDGTRYRLKKLACQGPIEGPIRYEGSAISQTIGIKLIAYDPMWYSDILKSGTLTPTQAAQLVFPTFFGASGTFFFGVASVAGSVNVQTLGDWDAAPIIDIFGPLSRPTVTNETTGETIELIYEVALGETVTITTTPGARDVYSNVSGRLQKYLVDGDFATFHLEPDSLIAPNGINTLSLRGATSGVAANMAVYWYDRYTGV